MTRRRAPRIAGVATLGLALAAACARPAPRPIAWNEATCRHCHMTIADPRFAAELVTSKGRVYAFDAVGSHLLALSPGAAADSLRSRLVGRLLAGTRCRRGGTVGSTVLALLLILAGPPAGRRIVVAPGGLVATVAEALRLARPGDTVIVTAGVYREPRLDVTIPVTILGEGEAVLDGGGAHEVLTLRADGVTVRGLTIRNVGASFTEDRAGIRLEGVRRCVIADNRLLDTFFGIYAARAADCVLSGNLIEGHATRQTAAGNGIHLFSSEGFTVTGNRIRGHRDGIYLEFSPRATILDNESRGNLRYGLHFMYSDSCEYRRNVFAANTSGVAVMYSRRMTMADNRFEDNRGPAAYGLLLKEIKDSRIEGNLLARNTVGLLAEGVDRAEIEGNHFVQNGWAIRLMADATDNRFRHNRFEANTFDVATNSQASSPSTFTENYWDAYAGYDLDRDGFGDVPFRPVRLFSVLVEQNEPLLILLRSFFLDLLEAAERIVPVLTPEALVDARPLMRWGAS